MGRGRMLVTGGSGFLGSVLSRKALEEGYEVWATYYKNRLQLSEEIHPVGVDLRLEHKVTELVEAIEPEIVIHTAYSQDERPVTFGGTSFLVQACSRLTQRPYFIFISTDLVFDGLKGSYKEEDEPLPVLDYGRDKLDAERFVRRTLPQALIVRTSLLYDRKRIPRHLRFAVEAVRSGRECVFFQDEYRSPILVDELAGALLRLAVIRPGGILHIAGADRVSRWWFGVRLLRALGFSTRGVKPGSYSELGIKRPPDCSLDSSRAQILTGMHFKGVTEVFSTG